MPRETLFLDPVGRSGNSILEALLSIGNDRVVGSIAIAGTVRPAINLATAQEPPVFVNHRHHVSVFQQIHTILIRVSCNNKRQAS